ncbi:MAG: PE-PPE domain-containing protein, partial [Mycobacterium sp.]
MAIAGVAGLGVSPGIAPVVGMKTLSAETRLLDAEPGTTALLLGGTGVPVLPPDVVAAIVASYIDPEEPQFPGQPVFPVTDAQAVYAPQQLYPLTGIPSMGFDESVQQGVSLMTTAIMNQFAAGNNVVASGESQGADILAGVMQNFLSLPSDEQPTADQLGFVNLIAEDGPSTGLLARFAIPGVEPLSFPSLGITLDYVEPSVTPWTTADYVSEYDGFSDFPQYPLNLLADLNAIEGVTYYHSGGNQDAATAIRLPVSDDYAGHTQYFIFPNEDLPLLLPLRQDGPFGNATADLLQPILKPLVNLGFGDPDYGYSTGPANELTTIGVFPEPDMVLKAFQEAVAGIPTGIHNFMDDLGSLPSNTAGDSLPSLADILNSGLA